jgi:cytochrome c553
MFKRVIFGLIVFVSILNAKSCICFEIDGKIGEEIKALIEKYKTSLKSVSIKNDNIDTNEIITKLESNLESKQIKEMEDKKQKIIKQKLLSGKKIFVSKCQVCHGKKAQLEAYNRSRALNTLTLEEIKTSIKGYQTDQYDRGLAMIMKPYANSLMVEDIEAIYQYIQTLK